MDGAGAMNEYDNVSTRISNRFPIQSRSESIDFAIPGMPVAWARAGRAKNGHSFTPGPQKKYMKHVKELAATAMAGKAMAPKGAAVVMCVVVTFPLPASLSKKELAERIGRPHTQDTPDWDNLGKIIADALQGIVYPDDKQVFDGRVIKRWADSVERDNNFGVWVIVEWETGEVWLPDGEDPRARHALAIAEGERGGKTLLP